jgi:hypothetical protein
LSAKSLSEPISDYSSLAAIDSIKDTSWRYEPRRLSGQLHDRLAFLTDKISYQEAFVAFFNYFDLNRALFGHMHTELWLIGSYL